MMERIDLSQKYEPIELSLHSCRYLPAKNIVAGKRVLDIACGEGVGVGLLLQWGAAEVVGVDVSQAAIKQAEQTYSDHPQARFVCSDAYDFLNDHGAEYDIITCVETIEHLPDPEAFLKKLAECRGVDSTLIISCPNDYFYFGRGASMNPYHRTQFSFYDFRSMSERYLGEPNWYLGAPNNGFSAIALDKGKTSAKDYAAAVSKVSPSVGIMVPTSPVNINKLKPSTSLFYLGIWSNEELSPMYQSAFPATSHFRLPKIVSVSNDISIGRTHRIAFVIDQHDWAFDNIVKNMEPYLEGRYNISYFYISDYSNKADLLFDIFVKNTFDNVHFMWREFLFFALSHQRIMLDLLEKSKLDSASLAACIATPALSTSVYDHLFLRDEDVEERQDQFAMVDAYATSSLLLYKAYEQSYYKKPAVVISDGVNLDFFAPARALQANRDVHGDQVVQIGWVGNSAWGSGNDSMVEDAKGLNSILVPAVEKLALEGYPVALALADRNLRRRNREEMVTYYGEIDILVCSSVAEGTPNPVLEAMASGVPFVSTNVGIVNEVAGPLQAEFVLKQRSVRNMYLQLKKLLDDPNKRAEIAAENIDRIQAWDWRRKSVHWLRLLANAEETHMQRQGKKLRESILTGRLQNWQAQSAANDLKKEMQQSQKVNREKLSISQDAYNALSKVLDSKKDNLDKVNKRTDLLKGTVSTLREERKKERAKIEEQKAKIEKLIKNRNDLAAEAAVLRKHISSAGMIKKLKSRLSKRKSN